MAPQNALVLDANILIRSVLGKKVRFLIEEYCANVRFFTPDVCFDDAEKYLPLILEKRGLSARPALEVLEKISSFVQIIDAAIYSSFSEQAKARIEIRDIQDWPIVATALVLDCPIWTEDSDFFGSGIATWTTDRVHLFMKS